MNAINHRFNVVIRMDEVTEFNEQLLTVVENVFEHEKQ